MVDSSSLLLLSRHFSPSILLVICPAGVIAHCMFVKLSISERFSQEGECNTGMEIASDQLNAWVERCVGDRRANSVLSIVDKNFSVSSSLLDS